MNNQFRIAFASLLVAFALFFIGLMATGSVTAQAQSISLQPTSQVSYTSANCSPNNQTVEQWYEVTICDFSFFGICFIPHTHYFYKVTVSSGTVAHNENPEIGPVIVGYDGNKKSDWHNYDKGGWQAGYPNARQLNSDNEYVVRVDSSDTFFDRIFGKVGDKLRICIQNPSPIPPTAIPNATSVAPNSTSLPAPTSITPQSIFTNPTATPRPAPPSATSTSQICPPPIEDLSFNPSSPVAIGATVNIHAKATWNSCFRLCA